jgi:PPM family protein phosphatase
MERVAVSSADVAGGDGGAQFRFDTAARSDVGAVRDHNEDFVFAGHTLLAVADGVGGSVYGEVASELVINAIAYLDDGSRAATAEDDLQAAATRANDELGAAIENDPSLQGMATTLSALRLYGSAVVALNVGDSRSYRFRAGELTRLTRDDSIVQDLVDAGVISEAEALDHPARAVVLEVLSGGPFHASTSVHEVQPGDRYLVCSDGLTDYVAETDVVALATQGSPSAGCEALVQAALAAGAPDNVSCVLADVRPL